MTLRPISRRLFLSRLGKGSLAVAVFGVAACSDSSSTTTAATEGTTTTAPADTTAPPTTAAPTTAPTTTTAAPTTTTPAASPAGARGDWQRVNLGFVSAYVLARGSRAAVVDTGVAGSAGDIEAALGVTGLGWDAVGDVILTHHHGDHVGSIGAVLAAAPTATAHAGEPDIVRIDSPGPLNAVGDGDTVFGLDIIETPGHTAGHISVLDTAAGVLVAGDALNGGAAPGEVTGANPRFTDDMTVADDSVRKLAQLQFETVLFGHGEPVEANGAGLLGALADSL